MDEGAKVPGQDALLKPEAKLTPGNGTSRSHAPRRWKLIRLALALLLVAIALTAWLLWDRTPAGPPQIVTLPNGEKYQFAGVTYGTKNVPPSLQAKVFDLLPKRLASLAARYVGAQISQVNSGQEFETPQLFVWFRPLGTNAPQVSSLQPLDAILADHAGIEAGVTGPSGFLSSIAWAYASFPVVPRRSRMLQCDLYPNGASLNPATRVARISFPNPLYGHFPQWKPEPVPAVKMAGDMEVGLDQFMTGEFGGFTIIRDNGGRSVPFGSATPGQPTKTGLDFWFRSPRGTTEAWVLHDAELADATGNVLRNLLHMSGNRISLPDLWAGRTLLYREVFGGTLWPDEAAWRLKLEVKRAVGFAPHEIVLFKDVPVPALWTTNTRPITKTAGGIQVVLTRSIHAPEPSVSKCGFYYVQATNIAVNLPGKTATMVVDLLSITTDAGSAAGSACSTPDSSCELRLTSIPTNAKTMDLTFVVQKTRTVEFLVAPPKPQ